MKSSSPGPDRRGPAGRRLAAIALLALLTSCAKCGETPAANGLADASARGEEAGPDASPPAKAAARNLLYTTDAVVAVSSKVDNPKDFPEHLVDGKPETAWNGRTGDLVGGWLAFRIPAAAHVDAFTISAGFDRKTKSGDDLFLMNHRITRVRVSRNGAVLREATLDADVRTPQPVTVDAPGGDFRVEVLAVTPGTRKEWRELTVSELAVWGDPGPAALPSTHLPRVLVGSLEAPARSADAAVAARWSGPFPSFDGFCKSHIATTTPLFEDAKDEYPGFIEGPYCEVEDALVANPAAPILEVRSLRITEWDQRIRYVGLRTPKGVFLTKAQLQVSELRNPGCAGSCSQEKKSALTLPTAKGAALVVVVDEHCWSNPFRLSQADEAPGSSVYTENAEVCMVDAAGSVGCTHYDVATRNTEYRRYDDDFAKVPWGKTRKRTVTASGDVVFE